VTAPIGSEVKGTVEGIAVEFEDGTAVERSVVAVVDSVGVLSFVVEFVEVEFVEGNGDGGRGGHDDGGGHGRTLLQAFSSSPQTCCSNTRCCVGYILLGKSRSPRETSRYHNIQQVHAS